MEDYLVYIFSSLFAAIGFISRFLWDFYLNRRKRELTDKKNSLEFKLNEFYYPIFFYLKREQVIWDKIIKLYRDPIVPGSPSIITSPVIITIEKVENNLNYQIVQALDEENLKIHKSVQELIHSKISIALPPIHLMTLLLQYDEHVIVYQILRKMNIYNRFPIEFDAPYPINLLEEIENRINELNDKYIKCNKQLN